MDYKVAFVYRILLVLKDFEKSASFVELWIKNLTFFGLESTINPWFLSKIVESNPDKEWKIDEFSNAYHFRALKVDKKEFFFNSYK